MGRGGQNSKSLSSNHICVFGCFWFKRADNYSFRLTYRIALSFTESYYPMLFYSMLCLSVAMAVCAVALPMVLQRWFTERKWRNDIIACHIVAAFISPPVG